jgi:hypothetical protein
MLTGWIHRRCLLLMISMDSWCIFSINWPEARTPARSWRAVSGVKAVQLPSCMSHIWLTFILLLPLDWFGLVFL